MKFIYNKTSGFLERSELRGFRAHMGNDYAMPMNTELRSVGEGVVSKIVDFGDRGLGKGVYIKMENGETVIYGHMNRISVSTGDVVDFGDLVGYSGNSGFSTGPHLHFATKDPAGQFIDPSSYEKVIQTISGKDEQFIASLVQSEPNTMQASMDQFMSQWNDTLPNTWDQIFQYMNQGQSLF